MMDGDFGNPASTSHVYGWQAAERVEKARVQVAELINADAREIIWTSGATESDNLAIKGVLSQQDHGHIVTSSYEHKAVLDTSEYMESQGYEVSYVNPDRDGIVRAQDIESAIRPDTVLVSIMHVNNELGTMNNVEEIGEICASKGVLFHVDAAQSVGKVAVDVNQFKIDMLSISGHKIYGPKGIGALFVRLDVSNRLEAIIHGGGHERGMRSGTLATHQIVGIGEAASIARQQLKTEGDRIFNLRRRLQSHITQLPGVVLNGCEERRIPGLINLAFDGVDGDHLLLSLSGVAVSSGSACTSAKVEPSYVLRAIGLDDALAAASLRFTVGRFTTKEDVDIAGQRVCEAIQKLRVN